VESGDFYGLVGQVLDGQFRVDKAVGEGGFSVVYRGEHLGLEEPVAIKCLKLQPQLGSAIVENFVRRFRDESRIHYKLSKNSLAIARTIGAGTAMTPKTGALIPYMVLEWLDGFSLSQQLDARRARGEKGRSLAEVVRLLDPVAEAMAMAHSFGVIHRDLNPSNIFIATLPGGGFKPKILDFGVAKVLSDHVLSLGPRAVTLAQLRIFTPSYGAPEQFDERFGAIGPWTDVYALALMVVELLTDRTPNEGEDLSELMDHACFSSQRPTPRALGIVTGDAVEDVMLNALAVRPTDRPSDIGEFWGGLKHAINHDSGHQYLPSSYGMLAAPDVALPPVAPATLPTNPGPAIDPFARTQAGEVRSPLHARSSSPPPPAVSPLPPSTTPLVSIVRPGHALPIHTPAPQPRNSNEKPILVLVIGITLTIFFIVILIILALKKT